ncbi:hypothetical protein [Chryseobacterium sp. ON_d1]|uniref:hypothetical protein n=1 Tax=Chryseobacterium sp. ON_d1 TaxID=2583211 RepID=UPI0011579BC0|nr:hypothetical protein [Chryseobacterium sp. ON_d1]GEJ46247.1 hypothetical protein CRS_28550 [Chryseobacterium sp. ON_d1]
MKDILEFEILICENPTDSFNFNSFITFIEGHSVYWGGGYSAYQINGSLYTDENGKININDFLKEFVAFFMNLTIKIIDFYFRSFEYDYFMKSYSSWPINIGYWEI